MFTTRLLTTNRQFLLASRSRSNVSVLKMSTSSSSSSPAGNPVHDAAEKVGGKVDSSPSQPSILSSGGAIGKQFNADGNVGQIGEKIGGVFSKDGAIGSQFNAEKGGIAGTVEKAVDGPSQKK